jgi:hypothetical protein
MGDSMENGYADGKEVHSIWLWHWIRALKLNVDYKLYCNAAVTDMTSDKSKLEQQYPVLCEFHNDFGDVFAIPTDGESVAVKVKNETWNTNELFKNYYHDRHHLFADPDSTGVTCVINRVKDYSYRAGNVLLNVRLYPEKYKTMRELERCIDFMYQYRDDKEEDFSGFRPQDVAENMKLMVSPIPTAKYLLHGDINEATLRSVEKALYVGELSTLTKDGVKLSQSETVLHILLDENNPMGDKWILSSEEKDDLANGRFKVATQLASKRKQLQFYREQCDRLVANAIHARFPDFS